MFRKKQFLLMKLSAGCPFLHAIEDNGKELNYVRDSSFPPLHAVTWLWMGTRQLRRWIHLWAALPGDPTWIVTSRQRKLYLSRGVLPLYGSCECHICRRLINKKFRGASVEFFIVVSNVFRYLFMLTNLCVAKVFGEGIFVPIKFHCSVLKMPFFR